MKILINAAPANARSIIDALRLPQSDVAFALSMADAESYIRRRTVDVFITDSVDEIAAAIVWQDRPRVVLWSGDIEGLREEVFMMEVIDV